jgi:hypothetical protein
MAVAAGLCVLASGPVSATTLSYDLNCVLNGLNSQACVPGPSFGTVTVSDTGVNQVTVVVDLLSPDLKFRDLMLNFNPLGSSITNVTSSDGQVSLSSNGYSINPYDGLFDLGQNDAKGWEGDSGYSTVLSGVGGTLTAAHLNFKDSLGKVFVGIHIQSIGPGNCDGFDNGTTNCIPGTAGTGSLKIGGSEIPEPSTFVLLGAGLIGLGLARRRLTGA